MDSDCPPRRSKNKEVRNIPDILMNLQSGVLSADPGTGTTLASGNFANLPLVAAPNTMRLVLDPDGVAGTPEIVIVTAHTAFATSVTVTRGAEATYGGFAARAHAVDTVWRHVITRATMLEMAVPAATILATVADTPDSGYLMIDGSTVVNAQVIYPATWARIPATWKSAPDMVMPDARGKTLFMNDVAAAFTLGAVGGSNSHAISQAELPAATIAINPPPTAVAITELPHDHGGATGAHAHTQQGTFASSGVGDHVHAPPDAGSSFFTSSTGTGNANFGSDHMVARTATGPAGAHSHTTPISGATGNASPSIAAGTTGITATVDIASFPSGNLGSGDAMTLVPANLCVNWQIKVH